jgi:hypothetical protein
MKSPTRSSPSCRDGAELDVTLPGQAAIERSVRSRVASLRHDPLTVHDKRIRLEEAAPLHSCQRTEPGIDGLAGTNLRFSEQGGP